MYYACGCKTSPWNCRKIIKTQKGGGGEKSFKKSRKKGRRDRKGRRKHGDIGQIEMLEYRICILFQYHTISIIAGPLCQFYSSCQKRGYHLNGDPFFVLEYYRKVCIKSRKLGLKIAKFSQLLRGHIPLRLPLFKQG